jgi:hypothetical protein
LLILTSLVFIHGLITGDNSGNDEPKWHEDSRLRQFCFPQSRLHSFEYKLWSPRSSILTKSGAKELSVALLNSLTETKKDDRVNAPRKVWLGF